VLRTYRDLLSQMQGFSWRNRGSIGGEARRHVEALMAPYEPRWRTEAQGGLGRLEQIPIALEEEQVARSRGVAPVQLGELGKAVDVAREKFEALAPSLDKMNERLERGRQLTEQQQAQLRAMGGLGKFIGGAVQRGVQVPPALMQQIGRAGGVADLAGVQEMAAAGGVGDGGIGQGIWGMFPGGAGMGRGADRLFRYMTNYWNLFRMRRIWGMTGGYAMGAIGPAAQYQQAGLQAAFAAQGGAGVPRISPMMGGILGFREQQARGFRAMGEAAYGAYGGLGIAPGLGVLGGIGLPALGAGAIAGIGAQGIATALGAAGAVSATGVGIPVALGVATLGGLRYARRQLAPGEPGTQLRAFEQQQRAQEAPGISEAAGRLGRGGLADWISGGWADLRASMATDIAPVLHRQQFEEWAAEQGLPTQPTQAQGYQGLVGRQPRIIRQPARRQAAQAWRQAQVAAGQRIAEEPLSELSGQEAALRLQRYAEGITGPGGALRGFRSEDVMGLAGQYMGYAGLEEPGQIPQRDLLYMAMTGTQPGQYVSTAGQLGMPAESWQRLLGMQMESGTQAYEQALSLYGQYEPMRLWMEPGEIMQRLLPAERERRPTRGRAGVEVPPGTREPWGVLTYRQQQAFAGYAGIARQALERGVELPSWQDVDQPGLADVGAIGALTGGQANLRQLIQAAGALQMPQLLRPQMVTRGPGGLRLGMAAPLGFGMGMGQFVGAYAGAEERMMSALGGGGFVGGWGDDTMWGLQDEQTRLRRDYQAQQYGFQGQALQAQRAYRMGGVSATGVDYGAGAWALRGQMIGLQRGYQELGFGFQERGIDLSDWYAQQRFGLQEEQQRARGRWGQEDLERQFGRRMTRLGWAEEDIAFRGATTALQFGWGMEDIGEQMRYATGRERRQLMRQRERKTIMYGMQMGRFEEEGDRIEQQRRWAEEDFAREEERHGKRISWGQERLELSRRYHEENVELRRERLAAAREHFEEQNQLEDEQRELQQRYWDENQQRQEDQLTAAKEYTAAMDDVGTKMTDISRGMDVLMSNFGESFTNVIEGSGSVLDAHTEYLNALKYYVEDMIESVLHHSPSSPYGD
jgi:hypothetical protein